MTLSVSYPKIVEFADGTKAELDRNTWKKRLLMVETDRPEEEVRRIFHLEEFIPAKFGEEIPKENQIGSGLIKKFDIWQMHVRLFSHEKHIAIDAEAEVGNDQGIEHLTHGWLSAFMKTLEIIRKHFKKVWIYHKGIKKYISKIIRQEKHLLERPKTKTEVKWIVAAAFVGIMIGAVLMTAMSKK